MTEILVETVIPIIMFALMFGMGLTLTLVDFRRILQFPRAVLVGLGVQLLVIPAVGLFIAYEFELSAMLAVGLVAVAASPGGTTSNVVVHVGKGDTPLSITLTCSATLATLFTLPLWLSYTLHHFGGTESSIEMPILDSVVQLGIFTIMPVFLGMIARRFRPKWVDKEPALTKISFAAMGIAFGLMAFMDGGDVSGDTGKVVVPTLLLIFSAVVLGFCIPKLSGVSTKSSVTIAVETTLKNLLISLFVAMTTLNSLEAALPSAVAITVSMPSAFAIMGLYHVVGWLKTQRGASL